MVTINLIKICEWYQIMSEWYINAASEAHKAVASSLLSIKSMK